MLHGGEEVMAVVGVLRDRQRELLQLGEGTVKKVGRA